MSANEGLFLSGSARRQVAGITKQLNTLRKNLRQTQDPTARKRIEAKIQGLSQQFVNRGRAAQERIVRERAKVGKARARASKVQAQSEAVQARTEQEKTVRRLEQEQKQRDIVSASQQRQKVAQTVRKAGFDPKKLKQAKGRFVDKKTTNEKQRERARQQAFTPVSTPAVTITGRGSARPSQLRPDVPESVPQVPLRASQSLATPPRGAVIPQQAPPVSEATPQPTPQAPIGTPVVPSKAKDPNLFDEFVKGFTAPAENLGRVIISFPTGVVREAQGIFAGRGPGEGQRFFEEEVQPTLRPTIIDEQLGRIQGEQPERNRVGVKEIGEILGEAALIAVPIIGGRAAGVRGAGKVKPPTTPLTKSPQQLIAGGRKTGKSEVFRPTNFFRRQVPSDVFAQDTASTFGSTRVGLGRAQARRPGDFVRETIPLGQATKTIINNPLGRGTGRVVGGGTSGGGSFIGPTRPRSSPPPPSSPTRGSGQILQQLSKTVEQQTKGSATFIKLGKGKASLVPRIKKPQVFTKQKIPLGRSTKTKVVQRTKQIAPPIATTALLVKPKQTSATKQPGQKQAITFEEALKLQQKEDVTFKIATPARPTTTTKPPRTPLTPQTFVPVFPTTQIPQSPAAPPRPPIIPIGFLPPGLFGGRGGDESGITPRGRKRRVLTPVGDRPGAISLAGFDIRVGSERELDKEEKKIKKASGRTVSNGKTNILDDPIGKIRF